VAKVEIPKSLPDCELIRALADKAGKRRDTDFDFVGELARFRRRVSDEVRYINVLFPDYTPHDEQYHLSNLFHVAGEILGVDRILEMNSAELLVLACGLYGHDWGMAVSEAEKAHIVAGHAPEATAGEDLCLLRDEPDKFATFARDHGLQVETEAPGDAVPLELWREYVRQTHAFRSGHRARQYFEAMDPALADAVARVCEGHWLNIEELTDPDSYPAEFPVLRELVNLRAVAIYVRLIDLFDLGHDRTPYVIWKFVASTDPTSAMEWRKHRAMHPATSAEHQGHRFLILDGGTDDHEVHAALIDLQNYCDREFTACRELLLRMNATRHGPCLDSLQWRIAARGFRPVSVRFDFNRERMFEILSDEIYQGDTHVFLRELLQNSIDAIRMRREVVGRRTVMVPRQLGVVRVNVERRDNGDAVVIWQDDGIGMDEYIVRNYLAVAGKSYYQSDDFSRQRLEMDPISRFGVGILSCFMVADRIEIETYKDPYLPPPSQPLKISIPSVQRQFHIEERPAESASVGTTVRVFFKGTKVERSGQPVKDQELDVVGYLSAVAGFVEVPIVITDRGSTTVILHPSQDAEEARERFGPDCDVRQLHLDYPWEQAILPQDLPTAREVLTEEKFDLKQDLGLQDYEGVLSYPVPADPHTDLYSPSDHITRINKIVTHFRPELVGQLIRLSEEWTNSYFLSPRRDMPSGRLNPRFAIYRDGILLAHASPYRAAGYPIARPHARTSSIFPDLGRLVVNLPKARARCLDLARRDIIEADDWAESIFSSHLDLLSRTRLRDLPNLDPLVRLRQLARFLAYHNVDASALWQLLPPEHWPVPFIGASADLEFLMWPEATQGIIYTAPSYLDEEVASAVWCFIQKKSYDGLLSGWSGEPFLANFHETDIHSLTMKRTLEIAELALNFTHECIGVRFVTPPWTGDPPLLQKVWSPVDIPRSLSPEDIGRLLNLAHTPTAAMNEIERVMFRKLLIKEAIPFNLRLPLLAVFPAPFERFYAYGKEVLNLQHPAVQTLVRLCASFMLLIIERTASAATLGTIHDRLSDSLGSMPGPLESGSKSWDHWIAKLGELEAASRCAGLLPHEEPVHLAPSLDDYVPGSLSWIDFQVHKNRLHGGGFGKPLT